MSGHSPAVYILNQCICFPSSSQSYLSWQATASVKAWLHDCPSTFLKANATASTRCRLKFIADLDPKRPLQFWGCHQELWGLGGSYSQWGRSQLGAAGKVGSMQEKHCTEQKARSIVILGHMCANKTCYLCNPLLSGLRLKPYRWHLLTGVLRALSGS